MDFESTRMGMKFFNRDIPALVDSVSRIADNLDKLNNLSSKEKHYYELLNSIIEHISNNEDDVTTIKILLCWGFTVEDLAQDFNFCEDTVKKCEKELDDFEPIY